MQGDWRRQRRWRLISRKGVVWALWGGRRPRGSRRARATPLTKSSDLGWNLDSRRAWGVFGCDCAWLDKTGM